MLEAALETDIVKRGEIYVEAQKAFMEDPAIMFLAYPLNFMPMRDWVKGYYFNPFFCQDLYFYPLSKG